jgi:hypothetical protein
LIPIHQTTNDKDTKVVIREVMTVPDYRLRESRAKVKEEAPLATKRSGRAGARRKEPKRRGERAVL